MYIAKVNETLKGIFAFYLHFEQLSEYIPKITLNKMLLH